MLAGLWLPLHKPRTSPQGATLPSDSSCASLGHHNIMGMPEIMGTSKILRQEQHKQPEGLPCPRPCPMAGARMCCLADLVLLPCPAVVVITVLTSKLNALVLEAGPTSHSYYYFRLVLCRLSR